MTEKFKVIGKYIKDMSSETPDLETYLFVKDYISKYQLGIDITSKPLKNQHIEVDLIVNPKTLSRVRIINYQIENRLE